MDAAVSVVKGWLGCHRRLMDAAVSVVEGWHGCHRRLMNADVALFFFLIATRHSSA